MEGVEGDGPKTPAEGRVVTLIQVLVPITTTV